jgi:RHS repeat-associated protein
MGLDYYPFGQTMPGRNWTSSVGGYRYSHNGHEKENEIFEGAQSAEYWMYDSRIGRRWERDPIVKPWESPYATFGNNPIKYNDVKGLTATPPDKILIDDKTRKQVGYQEDQNGTDYITTVYGYKGEDGGFVQTDEVTPEQKKVVEDMARKTEQRNAPTQWQKNMYKFCDNAPGMCGAVVVGAGAAVAAAPAIAAETGLIAGFGGAALKASLFGGGAYTFLAIGEDYAISAVSKGAVDAGLQVVINGGDNLDIADVAYSSLLTPLGSAFMGATTDYKPFDNDKEDFKFALINKDLNTAAIDFGIKLTFGGAGFAKAPTAFIRGTELGAAGAPFITSPINLVGKLLNKETKEFLRK